MNEIEKIFQIKTFGCDICSMTINEIAKILIEKGCDVNVKNIYGFTH